MLPGVPSHLNQTRESRVTGNNEASTTSMRLDKWLWAARFFKTRSSAAQAITGGKVHVNGERVKPARSIGAGDRLRIRRDRFEFNVTVLALNHQRRPAAEAQTLYEEGTESRQQREELAALLRAERAFGSGAGGRPDKKQRRDALRFKQGR
jgi:ribosome-associated heat shock protein Hsp15